MAIKVLISWPAWAGKSIIINKIVEKLWYDMLDIWQVFRNRALSKWLTVWDYDKLVENNPNEDISIDNEFKRKIEANQKDCIASWRMGFHFIPDALTIRLDVDPKEWARRVFLQDRGKQEKKYNTVDQAIKANQDRMKRLQKRLIKIYWADFMDKKNYKVIINTDWSSINDNAQKVIDEIEKYKKSTK